MTSVPAGRAARVVVADDHPTVRDGLRVLLATIPGLVVVGEARDGREALALCQALQPDLLLTDLRMPELDGLQVVQQLKQVCPRIGVLVLTMTMQPESLQQVLAAGADAVLAKSASRAELAAAIRHLVHAEPADGSRRRRPRTRGTPAPPTAGVSWSTTG